MATPHSMHFLRDVEGHALSRTRIDRVTARKVRGLLAAALALTVTSCGPVNEINRPNPVDMSKFSTGDKRVNVLGELGMPTATIQDAGNSCDMYQLYTHGPTGAAKGALAFGEAAADIVTLGLAEVLFTPIEGATSSAKHTVLMCYDKDSRLVSIRESDATTK